MQAQLKEDLMSLPDSASYFGFTSWLVHALRWQNVIRIFRLTLTALNLAEKGNLFDYISHTIFRANFGGLRMNYITYC